MKTALSPPYDIGPQFPRLYSKIGSGIKSKFMPAKRPVLKIPESFGLYHGPAEEAMDPTASFSESLLNNFLDDLNFYFQQATGMRKALLTHL